MIRNTDLYFIKFYYVILVIIIFDLISLIVLFYIFRKNPHLMYGPGSIINEFALEYIKLIMGPAGIHDIIDKLEEDNDLEVINDKLMKSSSGGIRDSDRVKHFLDIHYKDDDKKKKSLDSTSKIEYATLNMLSNEYPGLINHQMIRIFDNKIIFDAIYQQDKKDIIFEIKIFKKGIEIGMTNYILNRFSDAINLYKNISHKDKVEGVLVIVSDFEKLGGDKYKSQLKYNLNTVLKEYKDISLKFVDINNL